MNYFTIIKPLTTIFINYFQFRVGQRYILLKPPRKENQSLTMHTSSATIHYRIKSTHWLKWCDLQCRWTQGDVFAACVCMCAPHWTEKSINPVHLLASGHLSTHSCSLQHLALVRTNCIDNTKKQWLLFKKVYMGFLQHPKLNIN